RRRIVRTQAFDGAKVDMEKRAAKRCQAWNGGSRRASVPHPPLPLAGGCHLFPVVAAAYSIIVQAMTCSLSSLFLPHRFLARVETIVLFFLSEKSKEYLS